MSSRRLLWNYDSNYPPLLREAPGAPPRLICMGEALNSEDRYFAIVGTRHASPYGKAMADEFATYLSARGFVIVSGLAYGIDAIAHRAALDAGGRTIAVLGSGINHVGPPCNLPLAKEIIKHGTIITEFEDNMAANKATFPQRNRIIAGMSCATLVIEGPQRSGALITARFALEYNREVFALPGNVTQETSAGTNWLIRNGAAQLVMCPEDVMEFLEIAGVIEGSGASCTAPGKAKNPLPSGLSEDEAAIYILLKKSARSSDELAAETSLTTAEISIALSMLELKGFITMQGDHALVTR